MWGCVFEHVGEDGKGEKGKKKKKGRWEMGDGRWEMGQYNKELGTPCSCHFFLPLSLVPALVI